MSRSNKLDRAIEYAKRDDASWAEETLAREVERLEAEHIEAMAAITAASRAAGQERTRAEAAEARVKELEAQIAEVVGSQRNEDKSLPTWAQVMNRVALLAEQNARLRAALERLDALYISEFDHEDRPPRPQWLQAALNGEEAST